MQLEEEKRQKSYRDEAGERRKKKFLDVVNEKNRCMAVNNNNKKAVEIFAQKKIAS